MAVEPRTLESWFPLRNAGLYGAGLAAMSLAVILSSIAPVSAGPRGEARREARRATQGPPPVAIDPLTGLPLDPVLLPVNGPFTPAGTPEPVTPPEAMTPIPPSAGPSGTDPRRRRSGRPDSPPGPRDPADIASSRNPSSLSGPAIPSGAIPITDPGIRPERLLGPTTVAPFQVYVTAQEGYLNRFVESERPDTGPVRENILGADVYGEQHTTTRVRLNLIPGDGSARAQFVIEGFGEVKATGYTPQAAVNTQGYQIFRGTKDVMFDGGQLSTKAAVIAAQANSVPVSAMTPLSPRPILGPIAERVVLGIAARQKPQSDAIARDRVADQVFASFNSQVDQQLAEANQRLRGANEKLRINGLLPTLQLWTTTHGHIQFASQFGTNGDTFPPMPADVIEDHGISIFVHEQALNMAVTRSGLAGRVTTDRELRSLQPMLRKLLSASLDPNVPGQPVQNLLRPIITDDPVPPSQNTPIPARTPEVNAIPPATTSASPGFDGPQLPGVAPNPGSPAPKTGFKSLLPFNVGKQPIPGLANVETTIIFDSEQPLLFRVENDRVLAMLKAKFKPGGNDLLPPLLVTIPFHLQLDSATVKVIFEPVAVDALTDKPTPSLDVAENLVRQSVQSNLPNIEFPRQVPAANWTLPGPPPTLNYARSANGWIGIGLD